MFFLKKMVPVFGTDLVPETGGQRSETQPFVSFRCPPVLGTKKGPVFWNRHLFFGNPFSDFGASGMACSRPAEQPETIGCVFPFHSLLPG